MRSKPLPLFDLFAQSKGTIIVPEIIDRWRWELKLKPGMPFQGNLFDQFTGEKGSWEARR